MENATKALLIGAGMLFAVAVVSMVLYTYNQITTYYNSKQDEQEVKQQAEFNIEFSAYDRDDVTGFELVSLINKIINYNRQNAVDSNLGFENNDKNWTKMSISFEITDDEITEPKPTNDGETGQLFSTSIYNSEHSRTETELEDIIRRMNLLEKEYGSGVLSKLVSNRTNMLHYYGSGDANRDKNLKTTKEVLGKDVQNLPTEKEVIEYGQYTEFKRADFECVNRSYDDNTGRLILLEYRQK